MDFPWTKARRLERAALLDDVRSIVEVAVLGPASMQTPDLRYADAESTDARLAEIRTELAERAGEIEALARRVTDLGTAVSHGIEHEERRERRIQATVKRARKGLAELGYTDPALESEFDGLSVIDGGGSDGGELPAMREEVAEGAGVETSSVKGVTVEQLQRARGY